MPARVSRSTMSAPAKAGPKKKNKSTKRSLNAFAIAEATLPSQHKIRRSRLGQVEDDGPRPKRRREEDEEDEEGGEEDGEPEPKRRARDEDEESEDSDDDGNRWKMGVVEEDDDSDIDSEEAFGESDEEKFDGWTFRGGSGSSKPKAKKHAKVQEEGGDVDLEEPEKESDLESLGSDAVDLATMLDNYEGSEDEESGSGSEEDNEDEDDTPPSDFDMSDAEDEEDADRAARLERLVKELQPAAKVAKKAREADVHESRIPSAAGVVSSEKFDINDFLATTSDAQLKKVSKELGALPKATKKDTKLQPSLPKRQKDKLERIAANEKAKQTLERWVDTVKHQRRAEHLSFPIFDPDAANQSKDTTFSASAKSKPTNDLEAAIQNIMQESGLTSGRTDEEEAKLLEFEELQTNKLPIEEVQARRAELRKARDLLFREEVRAKRIKKIKSKAFRRIKRKEREKMAALDRDAFAEGMDEDMDEEERDTAERKRAEERMSLKHKDSKWAKQMKKSGRTTWDESAIGGVTEMARKSDELRRRIEGKEIRDEDASGDEILSSEDEDGASDENDDAAEFQMLQRQMQKAEEYGELAGSASKLAGMKFMQRAEARRRKENQDMLEEMRKDLNRLGSGSEDEEEAEEENIGRKIFAPGKPVNQQMQKPKEVRGEFEEFDEDDVQIITEQLGDDEPKGPAAAQIAALRKPSAAKPTQEKKAEKTAPLKSALKKSKVPSEPQETILPTEKHSQPDAEGWVTVTYEASEDEADDAENAGEGPLDQAEILRRAFAGDDVATAFSAEKHATILDEDDKIIDTTLPGWGNWVGSGLKKKDKLKKRLPHPKQVTTIKGVAPEKRKDAKLKGVIIGTRKNRAGEKYLAGELPHQFKTRGEYEGTLRMPVGGMWNTSVSFGENVRPRVLVKPGVVVRPMSKPLI